MIFALSLLSLLHIATPSAVDGYVPMWKRLHHVLINLELKSLSFVVCNTSALAIVDMLYYSE